jgi:hypothetical protein
MYNQEDKERPVRFYNQVPGVFERAFQDEAIIVAEQIASPTDLAVWPGPPEAPQWGTIMQVAQTAGSITGVVIRFGSQDYPVPAGITLGSSVELHAFGLLASSSPAKKCAMNCTIKKPDGTVLTGIKEMATLQNPGQTLRFTLISFFADQSGIWQAVIRYYTLD